MTDLLFFCILTATSASYAWAARDEGWLLVSVFIAVALLSAIGIWFCVEAIRFGRGRQ